MGSVWVLLTALGLDLLLAAEAANIELMLAEAPGFLMLGFFFLEPENKLLYSVTNTDLNDTLKGYTYPYK